MAHRTKELVRNTKYILVHRSYWSLEHLKHFSIICIFHQIQENLHYVFT